MLDYIRNHTDPLVSPYYDSILTFRVDKAKQAAACLLSLSSDPWFIEAIRKSQQTLPLAQVLIPNGPRSQSMVTVCPLNSADQVSLWC
jgi:hypothetical protein